MLRAVNPVIITGAADIERYAACRHIVVSQKGSFTGPVDDALEELGLRRQIVAVVPGFPDAMRITRQSDLVALVPRSCLGSALASADPLTEDLAKFELPVRTPEIMISAMWHPRVDVDPARRWLRNPLIGVCRAAARPH
jgi:DNA-binding transcriptional LysR family regulator